jgi:hypothetical protein
MIPNNPNRFIRGLSSIADIIDNPCVTTPVVTAVPTGSSSHSGTWIDFDFQASADGVQHVSLPALLVSNFRMYINGLKQTDPDYSVSGLNLMILSDMEILTGDVLSFEYLSQ